MGKRELPPTELAWEGARIAITNAEDLLASSRALSERDAHGHAASLAVLSMEEAVKAHGLLLLGFGTELPGNMRDTISALMRYHGIRHRVGLGATLILWPLMLYFKRLIEKERDDEEKNRPQIIEEVYSRFMDPSSEDEEIAYFIRLVDFWKEANDLKNAGLYSDFAEGQWRTPADIDRGRYEVTAEIVADVVAFTRERVDETLQMDDAEIKEQRQIQRELTEAINAEFGQ